jgi:hypothetical protein
MIPVKRCHDNVIALLIILPALVVHLAFQKIQFVIVSTPCKKNIRNTRNSPVSLDPGGGTYHPHDAQQEIIRR